MLTQASVERRLMRKPRGIWDALNLSAWVTWHEYQLTIGVSSGRLIVASHRAGCVAVNSAT